MRPRSWPQERDSVDRSANCFYVLIEALSYGDRFMATVEKYDKNFGSIEECVGRVCGHCSCGSISWTGPQHSITSAAAALAE